MGYTDDEKKDAVGQLIQGNSSFSSTALGELDSSSDFQEVIELAQSALFYNPDAIFYLLRLVANGINRTCRSELTTCTSLLAYIDDLSAPNKTIGDEHISKVHNMYNALLSMENSFSRSGISGGENQRKYASSSSALKEALGAVVKIDYTPRGSNTTVRDIVRSAPEAKALVGSSFEALQIQHASLLSLIRQFLSAYSEFQGMSLESSIGGRQIGRAATQVSSVLESLESLTSQERTSLARETLLQVIANESIVESLANRAMPGEDRLFQPISASPSYRINASGTGSPPAVSGSACAPFPLNDITTTILRLGKLNGFSNIDVDLFPAGISTVPGIKVAELIGTTSTFFISPDLATPYPIDSAAETYDTTNNGNLLHLIVDGSNYTCTLTSGTTQTANDVSNDINSAPNWSPSKPRVSAADSGGLVQISYVKDSGSPKSYRARHIEVVQGFGYAQDLWPWSVDPGTGSVAANRTDGWDGNNKFWMKANDDPSYVEVSLPEGNWPEYEVTISQIVSAINSAAVAANESFGAELSSGYLKLTTEQPGIPQEVLGEGAILTIASEGLYSVSEPSGDPKGGLGTPSYLGALTLGLAPGQEVRETDVSAQAIANVMNADPYFSARAAANIVKTVYLEARRAVRVSDIIISVPVDSDPTAGWPDYSEIKLAIGSGNNRGIYDLSASPSYSAGEVEFTLSRRLRDATSGLQHTITLYRELLNVASLDSSTTGEIQFSDPPSYSARTILGFDTSLYLASVTEVEIQENDAVYGWRSLDLSGRKISIGDLITDGYGATQTTVVSVNSIQNGTLGVESVSSDFSLSTSGFSIKSSAYQNYIQTESNLNDWLNSLSSFNDDLSFIDKSLAPLLLATSPAKSRVDTAYSRVESLKSKLDELVTLLSLFTIGKVNSVDALLQLLLERGYDRARDLLLQGRLADFDSLTVLNASYSRLLQSSISDVVVNDLNESNRATGRYDSEFGRIFASWEEDELPELDFSDLEEEPPQDTAEDYYLGINEFEG